MSTNSSPSGVDIERRRVLPHPLSSSTRRIRVYSALLTERPPRLRAFLFVWVYLPGAVWAEAAERGLPCSLLDIGSGLDHFARICHVCPWELGGNSDW